MVQGQKNDPRGRGGLRVQGGRFVVSATGYRGTEGSGEHELQFYHEFQHSG